MPPLPPLLRTELDPAEASAADPATGELRYNWSNICLHSFSVEWLKRVADALTTAGRYHVAHKKISSKDGPIQVRSQLAGGRSRERNRRRAALDARAGLALLVAPWRGL